MADAHHHDHHHSDMGAAYTGLLVGLVALLILVVSIVKLTNAHYNGEKPAAESTR
jgi:hypothetical protein